MNFKSIVSSATNATKKGAITTVDVTKAIANSPEVKDAAAFLGTASVQAVRIGATATAVTAKAGGHLCMAVFRAAKNAFNKENGDSKPNFLK